MPAPEPDSAAPRMIGSPGSATGSASPRADTGEKERGVQLAGRRVLPRGRWARTCLAAVLAAVGLAAAARAQPVLVDPDPDDPDVDWDLRLEAVSLTFLPGAGPLESPSALVFFGPRVNEEFLVLEKNTGRIRHFVRREEQALALDLAVDNCGERGLVDIALHPFFDPRPTPPPEEGEEPDPRNPNQDWVYLSYFTAEGGSSADGCAGGNAELHVARMQWNIDTGTLVPDPPDPDPDPEDEVDFLPFVPFTKVVDSTTAVGGGLATDLHLTGELQFRGRLYVSIGSLGHTDGSLQNNRLIDPKVFDDTSVVLRLDENGGVPGGNPFADVDPDPMDPPLPTEDDRYYLYGVRNPRRLAIDPFASFSDTLLWLTDQGDAAPDAKQDEIMLGLPGSNGGYSEYQGQVKTPLGPKDEGYPLVDLDVDGNGAPVGSYINPRFSFEDKAVDPVALEFGGLEVGARNIGALFVGATGGQLFRFALNAGRVGFLLGNPSKPVDDPLADTVASPTDDLGSILVAEGFGAISDVARGVDGSLYVLDLTNGTVHHLLSDARRDLALAKLKVPRRVTLKQNGMGVFEAKKPVRVTIVNQGEVIERILSRVELEALLTVTVNPVAGSLCTALPAEVETPWYAKPPYEFAIGIKPRGKLTLDVAVTWTCETQTPVGQADFETSAVIDSLAIGSADDDLANNVCPRQPDPATKDKGCGAKDSTGQLVAPTTDLIEK